MCLAETCQISKLHAERQSFSSCVWLGRQRRPLNILLPASHQAGGAGGAGVTAVLSRSRAGFAIPAQGGSLCYMFRVRALGGEENSPVKDYHLSGRGTQCRLPPASLSHWSFWPLVSWGSATVMCGKLLLLFTCCFMAVHTAQ